MAFLLFAQSIFVFSGRIEQARNKKAPPRGALNHRALQTLPPPHRVCDSVLLLSQWGDCTRLPSLEQALTV